MEIKDILKNLREEKKLTQDELAEHVMVTRHVETVVLMTKHS